MSFELVLATTMEWDPRDGESIEEYLARVPFVGTPKQVAPMTLPAERGDEKVSFAIRRGTVVNSHTSALELVRRGLGVALCMDLAAERDLHASRLARVWADVGFGFVAVTSSSPRKSSSPALDALRHFLFPDDASLYSVDIAAQSARRSPMLSCPPRRIAAGAEPPGA